MAKEELRQALLEYFKDNEDGFIEAIEELDNWNGYLGDSRWYDMYELGELFGGKNTIDLLNMAYFGRDDDDWTEDRYGDKHYQSFNPNRDYFSLDGYGNLVSSNYKDYSGFLDKYFVDDFIGAMDDMYFSKHLEHDIREMQEKYEDEGGDDDENKP